MNKTQLTFEGILHTLGALSAASILYPGIYIDHRWNATQVK